MNELIGGGVALLLLKEVFNFLKPHLNGKNGKHGGDERLARIEEKVDSINERLEAGDKKFTSKDEVDLKIAKHKEDCRNRRRTD